jgi:hypothetical protein
MADTHPSLLARATALLAGPFLLGQRALGLPFLTEKAPSPEPPRDALRPTVKPPEHAIKRRG